MSASRRSTSVLVALLLTLASVGLLPGPAALAEEGPAGATTFATSAGGSGGDAASSVSALADGSSIVTGRFNDTATFGDFTLTSAGGNDIFVAKLDADGNYVWATSAGGTGTDMAEGVSVLADGSAIVTGRFSGAATFGGLSLTATGHNNEHLFVAKISPTGSWLWATRAGATILDEGYDISAFPDGSALVTGRFRGTATFGESGGSITSVGINDDIFVAKISATGTWVWAARAGDTSSFGHRGFAVSALADGSGIVTGKFNDGKATFGVHTISGAPSGDDVFVAKISTTGTWEWAASASGTGNNYGWGVSALADGSGIVTGSFRDTATFGDFTLTSAGEADVFVAKISARGTWVWATRAGGTDSASGRGGAAVLAEDGSAIVTGQFVGTATFGDFTLTSAGDNDVFVAKLDPDGNWLWTTSAGGSESDVGRGVSVLADGSAIVTGSFRDTATFGDFTLTSAGDIDVFVAKISAAGSFVPPPPPPPGSPTIVEDSDGLVVAESNPSSPDLAGGPGPTIVEDSGGLVVAELNPTDQTVTTVNGTLVLAATGVDGSLAVWVSGMAALMVLAGASLLVARRRGVAGAHCD